jgi:adenosylcobinamide-GDP ribazoletransferase
MMRKMGLAFQFLTIIPVRDYGEVDEREVGSATIFFPVVGLVEGGLLALLAVLLLKVFPPEVVNALLLLVLVIMNGGLHLDGLADTSDAVASRGNLDKKLAIMKDSSTGPVGVIAIVMALLLNYVLLNSVHFYSKGATYFAILVLMSLSARWTLVPAIYYSKSARQDGLGRMFIEHTGTKEFVIATVLTFFIVMGCSIIFSDINLFAFYGMLIFPVLYALSLISVWFFNNHFEGLTGDSFGAVNEIARIIFLTVVLIWLQ